MGGIDKFFFTGYPLPAMPDVARQLVASFDDAAVDLPAIVELTCGDPALACRIVRLARPQSAGSQRAVSLHEVAPQFGMERLRQLVLAGSIAGAFARVAVLERNEFWRHAIATAGYARWFARILGVDPDSAFLAGYLLRSGQLLMAHTVPSAIAQVEAGCRTPGVRMGEEQRVFGSCHAEVTAELARRWRLPQRLIDGFTHAPAPLRARPFSQLGASLRLASVLADAGALGVPARQALEEADTPLVLHLRLDVPWLASTAPDYAELTAPVAALLG